MTNTIYVITQGEYSDYHIVCVFDDENMAQAYVDKFKFEEYYLEKYELNSEAGRLENPLIPYKIFIDKDGVVDGDRGVHEGVMLDDDDMIDFFTDSSWYIDKRPTRLIIRCYAKDIDHAVKIANERRIQYIALNIWGDNTKLRELKNKQG
jgi:hypothetical protein